MRKTGSKVAAAILFLCLAAPSTYGFTCSAFVLRRASCWPPTRVTSETRVWSSRPVAAWAIKPDCSLYPEIVGGACDPLTSAGTNDEPITDKKPRRRPCP
jgi:hypothetical protein